MTTVEQTLVKNGEHGMVRQVRLSVPGGHGG